MEEEEPELIWEGRAGFGVGSRGPTLQPGQQRTPGLPEWPSLLHPLIPHDLCVGRGASQGCSGPECLHTRMFRSPRPPGGFGSDKTGFKSQLCHLLVCKPQALCEALFLYL